MPAADGTADEDRPLQSHLIAVPSRVLQLATRGQQLPRIHHQPHRAPDHPSQRQPRHLPLPVARPQSHLAPRVTARLSHNLAESLTVSVLQHRIRHSPKRRSTVQLRAEREIRILQRRRPSLNLPSRSNSSRRTPRLQLAACGRNSGDRCSAGSSPRPATAGEFNAFVSVCPDTTSSSSNPAAIAATQPGCITSSASQNSNRLPSAAVTLAFCAYDTW